MMPVKKKRFIFIISAAVVLIAILLICLLSVSNLSEFFTHSDNMIVQVFEETDKGTVERLKVDLQPSSQAYQNIKAQIEAHIYFLSIEQPVGYPEFGEYRTWIYMETISTDMTRAQLLMMANDGTILVFDAQGLSKSATVLSGSSGKELYQALSQIISY